MGRGRAKAKQTKVARELKYRNFDTDFSELQRELHGDDHPVDGTGSAPSATVSSDDVDDYEDPYTDLYDEPESAPQR